MDNNITRETKVQAIIDKIRRYGLTEVILDGSDEGALEDWKIYDEDHNYDSFNYSGRKLYVHRVGIVDGELKMLGMWVTFGYGPDFYPLICEEKEDWESIPNNMLDCLYDTLVVDDADYEFEYTVKVSLEGITYEDNIVTCIDEGKEGKIVLPHGVKAIGHAFAYCEEITEVELPTTLNYIYASAFNNCSSLEAINLPKSLKHLYDSCFQACFELSSVTFNGPLSVIPNSCFRFCSSLKRFTFPEGLVVIGKDAFHGCQGFTKIDIPKGVVTIGDNAFAECENLAALTLPSSLVYIGEGAFEKCYELAELTLPSSLVYIGAKAFSGCENLTTVRIPECVKFIGRDAFTRTWKLNTLYLTSPIPPEIDDQDEDEEEEFELREGLPSFYERVKLVVPSDPTPYINHPQWGKFKHIESCPD
jgi:hypothetical protein